MRVARLTAFPSRRAVGRHVVMRLGGKACRWKNMRCIAAHRSDLQFYIKTFTNGGAEHTERCLSHFPHPYPSLKGLQVRCSFRSVLQCALRSASVRSSCCCCQAQAQPLELLPCAAQATLPCCLTCLCVLPVQKEIIRYKRADGLELNGTLYLPPGACA